MYSLQYVEIVTNEVMQAEAQNNVHNMCLHGVSYTGAFFIFLVIYTFYLLKTACMKTKTTWSTTKESECSQSELCSRSLSLLSIDHAHKQKILRMSLPLATDPRASVK